MAVTDPSASPIVPNRSAAGKATLLGMLTSPRALVRFFRDPKAPKWSKGFFVFAMIYVVSPIDAVPELFVPLLGFLDDIGFATIALTWLASTAAKYKNQIDEEKIKVIDSSVPTDVSKAAL